MVLLKYAFTTLFNFDRSCKFRTFSSCLGVGFISSVFLLVDQLLLFLFSSRSLGREEERPWERGWICQSRDQHSANYANHVEIICWAPVCTCYVRAIGFFTFPRKKKKHQPVIRSTTSYCLAKMEEEAEEEVANERGEVRIEMETEPLLRMTPAYLSFELGREPHQASRCHSFVLAIFRILFYSTGLWGHQAWNYIPRFLFSAICVYRAVFVVSVCTGVCTVFVECHANNTVTPNYQTEENASLMLAVAEVSSYHVFIVCLILAKRKDSALVTPSQAMMKLFDSVEIYLLFVAFSVLYIVSFSVACFYRIQQLTNLYKTAYIAALLAQWAAANACNAFAFSSFALGKLRESFSGVGKILCLLWVEVFDGSLSCNWTAVSIFTAPVLSGGGGAPI